MKIKVYKRPLSQCPKCSSETMEEIDTVFYGIFMEQHIICVDCGNEWKEVWEVKNTEEKESNERSNN